MRPKYPNSFLDADARRRSTVADDIRTPAGLPAPELSQPVPVCLRQRPSTRCEYTHTHTILMRTLTNMKYSQDLHLDLCFHSLTALSKTWGCGPVLSDEYNAFIWKYIHISLINISSGFCGGFFPFSYLVFRAQNNVLTVWFATFSGCTLVNLIFWGWEMLVWPNKTRLSELQPETYSLQKIKMWK